MPWQGRPVSNLVSTPDGPLDIHSPGLDVAGRVVQRTKRDGELGAPSPIGDRCLHLPHPVPVPVEPGAGPAGCGRAAAESAFAGVYDLTVILLTGWTGAEDKTTPLVVERVEDDLDAVAVVQRGVSTTVRDGDLPGCLVIADHADIQRGGGEDEPHLRLLRGRLPFIGAGLPELCGGVGLRPGRVAQDHPVHDWLVPPRPTRAWAAAPGRRADVAGRRPATPPPRPRGPRPGPGPRPGRRWPSRSDRRLNAARAARARASRDILTPRV